MFQSIKSSSGRKDKTLLIRFGSWRVYIRSWRGMVIGLNWISVRFYEMIYNIHLFCTGSYPNPQSENFFLRHVIIQAKLLVQNHHLKNSLYQYIFEGSLFTLLKIYFMCITRKLVFWFLIGLPNKNFY